MTACGIRAEYGDTDVRNNNNPIPAHAVGVFVWDDCETCYCLIQAEEDINIAEGPVTVVLALDPRFKEGIRLTMRNAGGGSAA